jgi:SAM-dependent methyltransferase
MTTGTIRSYPMDNDHPYAAEQHAALAALLDPFSQRRTTDLLDLTGRRCLEVGAGGGSFAGWLAEQVGDRGYVLATDIKPQHIPLHPRLGVLAHDLSTDPLPDEHYDLVHARLTLGHLPARRDILRRLAAAVAPGGVLLVEDWDASRTDMVLAAPGIEDAEIYTLYQETVGTRVFAATGTDRIWARRIHSAMIEEGLSDVDTVIHSRAWPGGGPGCRLIGATLGQLRGRLLAAGVGADQLDRVELLLRDPRLVLAGHLLFSTSGRRAAGQPGVLEPGVGERGAGAVGIGPGSAVGAPR